MTAFQKAMKLPPDKRASGQTLKEKVCTYNSMNHIWSCEGLYMSITSPKGILYIIQKIGEYNI